MVRIISIDERNYVKKYKIITNNNIITTAMFRCKRFFQRTKYNSAIFKFLAKKLLASFSCVFHDSKETKN